MPTGMTAEEERESEEFVCWMVVEEDAEAEEDCCGTAVDMLELVDTVARGRSAAEFLSGVED